MTRFIRNHCRIEWIGGSHLDTEDVVEPAHAASNGDTWVISRPQMREVTMQGPEGTQVGTGEFEPTGRTERIDQMTECSIVGDETDPFLTVTGQSTFLAQAGVAEEDCQVTVRIHQNPRFR